MITPTRRAPRGLRLIGSGLGALAMLAVATAARAQDRDFKGWFAALDLAQTQPNSLDQHYANVLLNNLSGTPDHFVRRLAIDNESASSWKGSVGYGFGKGLGSLQVSYWTFDHDQTQKDAFGDYTTIYPTVFAYGGNYGAYAGQPFVMATGCGSPTDCRMDLSTTSKVKAKTIDVDYVRPLVVGDVLTVKWLTGLRSATFEENLDFTGVTANYYVGYGTYYYTYKQTKHLKATGVGIRFGVTTVFGFSKHFSLEGGMNVSFLQAKVDIDSTQTSPDFSGGGGFPSFTDSLSVSDDNVRGEIREYEARAVWSYGPVEYYLGYGGATWDGLPADLLPGPVSLDELDRRSRDSISFNSARAGLVWRFGRK